MGFHTIVHIPPELQNRIKVGSPVFSTSSSMTSGTGTYRSQYGSQVYDDKRHFY